MRVDVKMDAAAADRVIEVLLARPVEQPEALNKVLAITLVDALQEHFRKRNAAPNRLNGPKTNFWNRLADSTGVASVSPSGALVTVSDQRLRIHLLGGTVVPKKAKALTIPLVPEARGLFARSYEQQTGRKLFSIPGKNALFERVSTGGQAVGVKFVRRRQGNRTLSFPVREDMKVRPVFALLKSVKIPRDPNALPGDAQLKTLLQEAADDYVARNTKGGVA